MVIISITKSLLVKVDFFYFIIVETGLTTTNQPIKIIIYEKRSYKYLVEPLIFYLQSGNLAEREALEPILSRNIIKSQIIDNHILSKV